MAADPLFAAQPLSALDARGRADLRAAARRRVLEAGARLFSPGDPADTLCVVERGAIALEGPGERPEVHSGELFGRDAFATGGTRNGLARALESSVVVEIPTGALKRALARAGAGELFAKEEVRARERSWFRLLAQTPLGARLPAAALEALLASSREERLGRGEALFTVGDPAEFGWIVLRGLVELRRAAATSGAGEVYAAAGDLIALPALLGARGYEFGASALGEVTVLRVPATALRALAAKHAQEFAQAEQAFEARREKQRRLQDVVPERATRHAFHELERLDSARSLLAIDLESCVRCGHCAWACADAHGSVRLARRGEKVALAVRGSDGVLAERALLLAQACQHCKDPACLPECPTSALARDASGTVLLHEDLCTGCGACAKACPWDAIRMAQRTSAGATTAQGAAPLVAAKCDLCHGLDGPECVSACPTGSLLRADPDRDLVAVRSLHDRPNLEPPPRPHRSRAPSLAALAAVPPLLALARLASSVESSALRYVTGGLAGAVCVVLALHSLLKRKRAARSLADRWFARLLPKRGLEPFVSFHALTGVFALFAVLAHAGFAVPRGTAGALSLAFWLVATSGVFGALAYRVLPRRLARLERRGSLPEDRALEREELAQALFDAVSGNNAAVKELVRRVLAPYAHARLGALVLAAGGRSLAEEERALSARIEALLGGRKSDRLAELDKLVRVAVALRALDARKLVERLLGAWLPLHAAGTVLLLCLLALHVVGVVR